MALLRLETCCLAAALLSKFWPALLGRLLWLAGEIPVSVKEEAVAAAEVAATPDEDDERAPIELSEILALECIW